MNLLFNHPTFTAIKQQYVCISNIRSQPTWWLWSWSNKTTNNFLALILYQIDMLYVVCTENKDE